MNFEEILMEYTLVFLNFVDASGIYTVSEFTTERNTNFILSLFRFRNGAS
jgi:hypothetical protein